MQDLFHSAFLQALGKAIADSIWQMGLLFLAYQLLVCLFRIKQSTVKNFISTVLALGGFVWFVTGVAFRWQEQLQHKTALVISEGNLNGTLLSQFAKDNRWELFFNWLDYKIQFLLPYLSIAYLFVLLWFAVKLFVQLQAANSLRYKGIVTIQDDMQEFFSYLVETMHLQRPVQLFISTQIDIPATLGFLKPIVLLPATAVTHLTAAQLEAVLLHELAHIKRNDYFWNLLLSVSETMMFFNPFALLLIGIARRERENSCDDHVMNYQQNAAVYAEALLNVEKARVRNPQLVMALGDNKHHLMDRVKRILNIPAEKNKISTRLLALLLFTIVFASMGWLIKQRQPAAETKQTLATKQPEKQMLRTVFFTTDSVVGEKNNVMALRDVKQKITLKLNRKTNSEDILVWNELNGEELKFDKVIFNEMPAEWIEQLVKPRMAPSPEAKERRPRVVLRNAYDSAIVAMREKEMEVYLQNMDRMNEWRERLPQQPMRIKGGGTVMHRNGKQFNLDSMMQKLNGRFAFAFEGQHAFPEVSFPEYFPQGPEAFYFHQREPGSQQATDEAKKKQVRAKFTINRKMQKEDSTDNDRLKRREKNTPVIAFLYNTAIHDKVKGDKELTEESHIRIVVDNVQLPTVNGQQLPNCSCPDVMIQEYFSAPQQQQPAQPKRVVKRLEVIRL